MELISYQALGIERPRPRQQYELICEMAISIGNLKISIVATNCILNDGWLSLLVRIRLNWVNILCAYQEEGLDTAIRGETWFVGLKTTDCIRINDFLSPCISYTGKHIILRLHQLCSPFFGPQPLSLVL